MSVQQQKAVSEEASSEEQAPRSMVGKLFRALSSRGTSSSSVEAPKAEVGDVIGRGDL